MKSDLVNALDGVMISCANRVKELVEGNQTERVAAMNLWKKLYFVQKPGMPYAGPEREDYRNVDFDSFYMTKFGYAYAFEYAMIYDAILRCYTGDKYLCVACMGCGSMIDAWSLAYARARIDEEDPEVQLPQGLTLRYYGYDGVQWGMYLAGKDMDPVEDDYCIHIRPVVDGCYAGSEPTVFRFVNNEGPDIADVFGGENAIQINKRWKSYEILMFGKIFNELEDDKLEQTIEYIEEAACNGEFTQKELYICISHNYSGIDQSTDIYRTIAERIVNAINHNHNYTIDGSVMENSPLFTHRDRAGNIDGIKLLDPGTTDEKQKYYVFNRPYEHRKDDGSIGHKGALIADLNNDFAGRGMDGIYSQVVDRINASVGRAKRMKRTSSLAMQVIKLTRNDRN